MKKQINIEGMSCGHCAKHVEEALKEIGAANVTVSLEGKYAIAESSSEIEDSKLKEAVEEAGYDVTGIKSL
ncbi:Copper chaperone CopZ [bioreactor metagenome]|uniref:Cation transporter n=2 Tax=root TaxID=1 RepID=A0ABT1NEL9_9FIRM|nr:MULTISPECIES: cation transporter [Lutispora]MCQ1529705.1 cation transporter [Lutispora saccharofermentans]MEA4961456.1 cation transporter [Lutispora sp.]HCJ57686.1 heavy metal transport/detoxification protein [Clostridiaceae bacterium]